MPTTAPTPRTPHQRTRQPVIDCDVHNELRHRDDLKAYLPARWHGQYDQLSSGPSQQTGLVYGARPHRDIFRRDAVPESGPPGSDLDMMRDQLLDRFDITRAILHPVLIVLRNPTAGEQSRETIAAVNRWMAERWLEQDDRLFGAISVPIEDPEGAANEIRSAATNPRFVKVMFTVQTREPLGHAKYWPAYEAAVEHDLPIAAHVGGFSGTHTATGWPTYWIEQHVSFPQMYAAQVTSLVCSGIFSRLPTLRFVLEEGGLTWIPALMWRLDHAWRTMRRHVAHLEEPPSAIIRRHFAFTTQPMDEPSDPRFLRDTLEQLDMNDRIMFASDYPHWDFDSPTRVLGAGLVGPEARRRILHDNADAFFNFPEAS